MFSLEYSPVTPLKLAGLEPTWIEMRNTGAQFDLSLYLTETNDSLVGRFSFNSDLFDQETIVRMAGHYRELLTEVVRDSGQPIEELQFLTGAEREALVSGRNISGTDDPAAAGITELFEQHVAQAPAAIAVECAGERLTYAELSERSSRIAAKLQSLGAGPGDLVAVCLERSVSLATGLLAVLKAGAAYLPLDLGFPRDRLSFMMQDALPRVLITTTDLLERLPAHDCTVICLDHFADTQSPPVHRSRFPEPTDRAYLLYTSGSTGQPKGVEISHRALTNFLTSMRKEPGMARGDVLLSVTTISFDIFGLELWLPLTTGAKVVITTPETSRDGRLLAGVVADSGATVMQATPTTWRLLLDAGWQGSPKLKILCGGEAWRKDLAGQLLSKCASLWNMYGPTETTIWSAAYRVQDDAAVRVGPPVANTQFYVVDARLQLQPLGVPGELLIGGDGLALGYWNLPEVTAGKFIPNPFDVNSGSRLYRTGDLMRTLPDGTMEFLSRLDNQVKVRGFRIELGEIEAHLRAGPSVEEAVVVLRQEEESQLVAFCVLSKPVEAAALRQLLKQVLPDYMIPAEFVFVAEFPLTPNGKIDRKALLAMPRAQRSPSAETTEPRDHLERQLTVLFERILQVRPVHTTDDFFDLGGHSFSAVRLVSEIHKLMGRNLPLATFFQAATVESLADVLRRGESPSWSVLVPIRPGGSKPPLFLVHGAEGNVLLYRRLVEHLGLDQPVYGLQSQGLDGEQRLIETVEEMAASYIREIVTVQPYGPYLLGGYCLGGVIALEIAQQLTAAGNQVELVVMFESYNSGAISPPLPRVMRPVHRLQNFWFHLNNIAMLPGMKRRAFVAEKLDVALTRLRIRLQGLAHRFQRRPSHRIYRIYPHLSIKRINDRAAFRYQPRPYRGRVAVMKPKRFFSGLDEQTLGWGEVLNAGLEVHELAVYPKGMLVEPFCRELAEKVTRCLTEVREAQTPIL
jgi:amino acid adenylation domain-containing protein